MTDCERATKRESEHGAGISNVLLGDAENMGGSRTFLSTRDKVGARRAYSLDLVCIDRGASTRGWAVEMLVRVTSFPGEAESQCSQKHKYVRIFSALHSPMQVS